MTPIRAAGQCPQSIGSAEIITSSTNSVTDPGPMLWALMPTSNMIT